MEHYTSLKYLCGRSSMTAWLFVTITPDTPSSEQRSSAATTLLEFIRKWHSLSASTAFNSLEVLFELPNPDLTNLFTTTAWAKWIGEIISTYFWLQCQHQHFVVAIKPILGKVNTLGTTAEFPVQNKISPDLWSGSSTGWGTLLLTCGARRWLGWRCRL